MTSSSSSFAQLGLYPWLIKQCDYMMIHEPREIQQRCIPAVFAGHHIAAGAPTGSGKTAAFALPLLQILSDDMYGVFALVLTASRELAYQIQDQFVALGAPVRLRTSLIIGGVRHEEQLDAIQARPHVMIATPGRLVHVLTHFAHEVVPAMRRIRFLVLDEADRLIDGDMQKDMRVLLQHLPPHPQRRVLMFSATLTPALIRVEATSGETANAVQHMSAATVGNATAESARTAVNRPRRHDTDAEQQTETNWTALMGITDSKTLSVFRVRDALSPNTTRTHSNSTSTSNNNNNNNNNNNFSDDNSGTTARASSDAAAHMSSSHETSADTDNGEDADTPSTAFTHTFPESLEQRYLFIPDMVKLPTLVAVLRSRGKEQSTIVFTNSCVRVELVRLTLQLLGFPVCSLNGLLTQQHRLDNLARFKLGLARIMVCTDVASRGLDIPAVSLVLHYDLPKHAVTYVHRVGRTARAQRAGQSLALLSEYDVQLVQRLERKLHLRLRESEDAARWESEVVKLLDEVSEAKIQAKQQVVEQFGNRAMTRKQQRAGGRWDKGGKEEEGRVAAAKAEGSHVRRLVTNSAVKDRRVTATCQTATESEAPHKAKHARNGDGDSQVSMTTKTTLQRRTKKRIRREMDGTTVAATLAKERVADARRKK